MSSCDEMKPRKCGDMTYASYLARKCGKCIDQIEREREITNMQVSLPNGVVVSGSLDQVNAVARTFGYSLGNDGVHYNSNSRGLIKIVDMDNTHLANAIRKIVREFDTNVASSASASLTRVLRSLEQDKTYKALVAEYERRTLTGRA